MVHIFVWDIWHPDCSSKHFIESCGYMSTNEKVPFVDKRKYNSFHKKVEVIGHTCQQRAGL